MPDGIPLFKKNGFVYKEDIHKMYPNDFCMTRKVCTNSSLYLNEFSEVQYTLLSKVKYKKKECIK